MHDSSNIYGLSNTNEEIDNLDVPDAFPGDPTPEFDSPGVEIPKELQDASNGKLALSGSSGKVSSSFSVTQPVVFTVLHQADGTGKVPYTALVKQIEQLNRAFSGEEAKGRKYQSSVNSGIRFTLHAVQYVQNDDWFNQCTLPSKQKVFRPQVAADPSRYYNVYVCWVQNNIGLAWLPYAEWFRVFPKEDSWVLGSSIDWRVLPGMGGKLPAFKKSLWNQGNMLVHETGHHYGLKHPYQDDCVPTQISDGIQDTPRMSGNPMGRCKDFTQRKSCPSLSKKEDVSNYMLATNDDCRSHFTPGQVAFMQATINQYKPSLKSTTPLGCVAAIDDTDQSPDLAPCIDMPRKTASPSNKNTAKRPWCRTSRIDAKQWAWACCPASNGSPDGEGGCRRGTPTF